MEGGLKLAGISIAENQALPSAAAVVNWEAITENFLRARHYVPIHQEGAFRWYANLIDFTKYYICDVLVVAHAEDFEAAEDLVPQLDAECARIRRLSLRGKQFSQRISVLKHHFITLHKPYYRYSYAKDGKPVGFSICPVIVVKEKDQWDYLLGPSTQIDVVSSDAQTLNYFMDSHKDVVRNQPQSKVNFMKYRHWKVSNALLEYGHYPLIVAWILFFFCVTFQVPIPLTIGSMATLTAVIYGGFVGFTYLSYQLFQKSRVSELQAASPHVSQSGTCRVRSGADIEISELTREVPQPLTIEPQRPEQPMEVRSSFEPTVPTLMADATPQQRDRYFKSRIGNTFRKMIKVGESKIFVKLTSTCMRYVFSWVSERDYRTAAEERPLSGMLVELKHDDKLTSYLKDLSFWAKKIDTQTPFTPDEIHSCKRFLQQCLGHLRMLPRDLRGPIQPASTPSPVTQNHAQNPSPSSIAESTGASSIYRELAELEGLVEKDEPPAQPNPSPTPLTPSPIPPEHKEPLPNLGADAIAISSHVDIAGINGPHLRKVLSSGVHGLGCYLFVDPTSPDLEQVIVQFNHNVKGLDLMDRGYGSLNQVDDPSLRRKIEAYELPVVLVACGSNLTFVSYGQPGDAERLTGIVRGFERPPCSMSLVDRVNAATESETPREHTESPQQRVERLPEEPSSQSIEPEKTIPQQRADPIASEVEPIPDPPPPTVEVAIPQTRPKPPVPKRVNRDLLFKEIESLGSQPSNEPPKERPQNSPSVSTRTPPPLSENVQAPPERISPEDFKKGSILIDGSNIMFLGRDHNLIPGPDIKFVLDLIDEIVNRFGVPKQKIMAYFDPNIKFILKDAKNEYGVNYQSFYMRDNVELFFKYERKGLFRRAPPKTSTDTTLVQLGSRMGRRFIVVANDKFEDGKPAWFRQHRIAVGLDTENHPYLSVQSQEEFENIYLGIRKKSDLKKMNR